MVVEINGVELNYEMAGDGEPAGGDPAIVSMGGSERWPWSGIR